MVYANKQEEASKRKTPDKEKISDVPKKINANETMNKVDLIVFNFMMRHLLQKQFVYSHILGMLFLNKICHQHKSIANN